MTVGSAFTGIGGFDLGFHRAGFDIAWQIEIELNCQRLLKDKFPGIPIYGDIRDCGQKQKHELDTIDIFTFGWPCQGNSVAGKRGGLKDSRSGLFFEALSIVRELRPRLLVWENVPGLFSVNQCRDFARCLLEISKLGYCGGWRVLDAQFFGVPQRRRRPIGVFARNDLGAGPALEILSLANGLRRDHPSRKKTRQDIAGTLNARTRGGGGCP